MRLEKESDLIVRKDGNGKEEKYANGSLTGRACASPAAL
jgi:hypothetical protein